MNGGQLDGAALKVELSDVPLQPTRSRSPPFRPRNGRERERPRSFSRSRSRSPLAPPRYSRRDRDYPSRVYNDSYRAGRRLPCVGPHHEIYTVRAPARVRVLGSPIRRGVYTWPEEEVSSAMSVAGTVEGAAQDRTAPLCARAALGLGRPLGPGPGQGSALALDLTLVLVLAHVPARARVPRRTLRRPGVAVGPDPIAGVVEAIVETISGTAGLARLPPKIHDGRII